MSTAVVTKKRRSPLRMIRDDENNSSVTYYHCGIVQNAVKNNVPIVIVQRDSDGNITEVKKKPHIVHKKSLRDVYGPMHATMAGRGKYIDSQAYVDRAKKHIVGAHYVSPYLPKEGCHYAIVQSLKDEIGSAKLKNIAGEICRSDEKGEHILWDGERTKDDCIVASEWMTEGHLWSLCNRAFPQLVQNLKRGNFSPRRKFSLALAVLSRPVEVVDISTGTVHYYGGMTPYAKPLEQCGMAIDRRFLTFGVKDGEELAQYYYRLVIGRSQSHSLKRSKWACEGMDSDIAWLNPRVKREVSAAKRTWQDSNR